MTEADSDRQGQPGGQRQLQLPVASPLPSWLEVPSGQWSGAVGRSALPLAQTEEEEEERPFANEDRELSQWEGDTEEELSQWEGVQETQQRELLRVQEMSQRRSRSSQELYQSQVRVRVGEVSQYRGGTHQEL